MRKFVLVTVFSVIAALLIGNPAAARPAADLGNKAINRAVRPGAHSYAQVLRQREALWSATRRNRVTPLSGGPRVRDGLSSAVPGAAGVGLDKGTDTLYVASLDGTISVIDARSCNAVRQRCHAPIASMPGRTSPGGPVVDPVTHSVYVTDFDTGSVLVFDGAHCNARVQTGCSAAPAVLTVGGEAVGLALDATTHTGYVGNVESKISVFDVRACNARRPAGCAITPAMITAGPGPAFPTVDSATHTLFVPDNGSLDQSSVDNSLTIIDIAHCRAGDTSGCAAKQTKVPVGSFPVIAQVDRSADTVYVSNQDDASLSVLPYRSCNARDTSGCPTSPPPTIAVGFNPQQMAVDAVSRTLYLQAQDSDVVNAIDTELCNAHDLSQCPELPRSSQTGATPFWMIFDQRTRTIYTADVGDGILQAQDGRVCSAQRRSGCRHEVPSFNGTTAGVSFDPRHHSLYQSEGDTLWITDTQRCRVGHVGACDGATRKATVGGSLDGGKMDPGTHTLYLRDNDSRSVKLIDTASCNATHVQQCRFIATVPIPGDSYIGFPQVNRTTHSVYFPEAGGKLVIIRGAHCNAADLSGCARTPQIIPIGGDSQIPGIDERTNTIYVPFSVASGGEVDRVAVIPGAACDQASSACRTVATTTVGVNPISFTADAVHHTLYAAIFGANDQPPGQIALLDTNACNARHTSGCSRTWPSAPTPRTPFGADLTPGTHTLVITNFFDTTVALYDVRHCNTSDHTGCRGRPLRVAVSYLPVFSQASVRDDTIYVTGVGYAKTSLIDLRHPCRQHRCFR